MIKLRIKINHLATVSTLSLLMLGIANPLQAESFDRIFTTAKQRAILDNIRRYSKQKKVGSKIPQTVFNNKEVNVNGVVFRSDGINTVWINGKSNLKTNKPEAGVKIYKKDIKSDSVTITLSNPSKRITLKPGQTVDPLSGKIRDRYRTITTELK